jgi:hypothetical protein
MRLAVAGIREATSGDQTTPRIAELTPQGGSRFVRIAWPKGKPPAMECLPPA